MAQVVKLKRSSVEGKVPTTSNLELGELSINTHDGRAFLKKNDGSDSIEHLVTTNSQTTGSIELIGNITASGGISSSGVLSIPGFTDVSASLASSVIPDGTISSSAQIEDALPAILPEVHEFVTASKVFVLSAGGSNLKNIPLVSGTGVQSVSVDSDLKMQYSPTGNKLVVPNVSASGNIIVSDITASGDIIPNAHITSNLGNDDNYFLTASIAHVRTFDSTIEFVDPATKAPKGFLQITDANGLEVKDGSNALTTISASNARITNKLQADSISFSGALIGTITGGTF
jgi:hypothetical protein